jgi:hypothetical protein
MTTKTTQFTTFSPRFCGTGCDVSGLPDPEKLPEKQEWTPE